MIELIKNYRYDNRYEYVKSFNSKVEQSNYFNSLASIVIDTDEYARDNEVFDIEKEYDYLVNEGVNYLIFNNGYRDIFAFITSKEYISNKITRITFEVDVFQTFMFSFSINKSFVERKKCEINEITDYDEGVEIGEHSIVSDTTVIDKNYTLFAMFNGFKDFYVPEGGKDYKEFTMHDLGRSGTIIDGITYPMSFFALETDYEKTTFYTNLLDHPSLVGIVALPNATCTKSNFFIPMIKIVDGVIVKDGGIGVQNLATNITSSLISGGSVSVPKSEVTDFFPYTYYTLTDGETEPLVIKPQFLNTSSILVTGKFALSHAPVERYYPMNYKGDTTGRTYNITNTSCMMLPVGTNGGIETLSANAMQYEQNKKSMYANILMGAISTGVGVATGGVGLAVGATMGASAIVNSFNTIRENMARNSDIELTPSSIKSYGNPSTRVKFGTNNVRVQKHTIQDKYKNRLLNYIERYGNKFNNYATINHKSYKGYIKFVGVDVDSSMDMMFTNKIIEVLERGVFFE